MSDTIPGLVPAVELDLSTCSSAAFFKALAKFQEWSNLQEPVGPLDVETGWHEIDWQVAQDWLRRNSSNREIIFNHVKKLYYDMSIGDWRRTGQPIVFNERGKLNEGQHRLLGCYFGKVKFSSFVVTDVPDEDGMFAYYDDNRPRSAADALQTSGQNGLSKILAPTVQLAWRYRNGLIGIFSQPKVRKLTNRQVMAYSEANPSLGETGHIVMTTYPAAVDEIGNKMVAILFADEVIIRFGPDVLDDFYVKLSTGKDEDGNDLDDTHAVAALRRRFRIDRDSDEKITKERLLALLIKDFNFYQAGRTFKVPGRGLFLADNEPFPQFATQPEPAVAE